MKIIATFGQDTPAYADMEIEVPDGASEDQIRAAVLDRADEVGNMEFAPSYDWTGLRVVSVTAPDGDCLLENIPIEPSGEDLGLEAMLWLRGRSTFVNVLAETRRQGILSPVDVPPPNLCFDLVIEAMRSWDEGGDDLPPARTYAKITVDADLWTRLEAAAQLVRMGGLTEAVIEQTVTWGNDIGAESTSRLSVDNKGHLRAQVEINGSVYESFPVLFSAILPAWTAGTGSYLGREMLRDGHTLFVAHPALMDSLKRMPGAGEWVIYHALQPRGERFWSDITGWCGLAGATRFVGMPEAPYPFGGPEDTQAAALRIGTMRDFVVTLRDADSRAIEFECFAKNEEHAIEQAQNAYPGNSVESASLAEDLGD